MWTIQKNYFIINRGNLMNIEWPLTKLQNGVWSLVSIIKTEFGSILLDVNTQNYREFSFQSVLLLEIYDCFFNFNLWSFGWRIDISIDSLYCIILDWIDEIVKSKSYCCDNISIVDELKEWKMYFCTIMKIG